MSAPDRLQELLEAVEAQRARADAALARERELQDRLDRIVSSVPGVACAFKLHADGRASMPFVSAAGEDVFGLSPAVLEQDFTPFQENMHRDDVGPVMSEIAEAARTLSRWHATFRYRHPSKGLRWLEGWSVPSKEPDGGVVWFGYVADVTERRRADAELREQASLLELAHDAVIVRGAGHEIRYWNEGATRTYGWTGAEAVGRVADELLGTRFPRPRPEFLAEVAARGSWDGELDQVRKDGERILVASRWAVHRDRVTGEVGFLEINRDLSQVARAAKVMREWLEGIPAIAWRTDPHGNLVERNRRWLDYTGQTQSTGVLEWLHLVHPDEREGVAQAVRDAVAAGGPFEGEFRLRRADGVYRWILGRASAVRDASGALIWMGIGTDIEDRKRMEQVLREADQQKNQFLAVLGHELRNPLAPIASSLFVLHHSDPDGERSRQAQEIISHQVEHLTRLVDDLLDVTRIERGRIELRRVRLNLNEVVRRSAEDRRAGLEEHGISLVVDTPARPAWVDGDATRLAQIVGNLLHNAAKFTASGGRVTVAVRDGPEATELSVRDTGAGIDPMLLGRVFEPFTQGAQSLARTAGGLGLGLALVKGLAELHGGSATASSEGPGRGAEVVVRLPVAAPPPPAEPRPPVRSDPPAPPSATPAVSRRLHVLVVEDIREAAESLAQVLEILGHEAEVAPDGPAALEKAQAHKPDVVLCDIGLPGMSGYEVARALRSGTARDATLVAISGYALPEDRRASAEAGFDQHLAKPARLDDLERLLATVAAGAPAGGQLAGLRGR